MEIKKLKRRWEKAEISYLQVNYDELSIEELSKQLSRSIYAVRWMAVKLELTEKQDYWAKEEVTYLALNYTTLPLTDIAAHLKRSISAVRKKAGMLNLAKVATPTNDNLPIEKQVPFFKGKTGEFMQILHNMEIGDSFVYPNEDRQTIQNCTYKFADRLYRSKDVDGLTRRMWRLL